MRQNPYFTYESILRVLSAERIGKVLEDQELLRDKWRIHFAIDPYDIGKFCFPFSSTSLLSQFKPTQIEEIAKLQNGRYEAVYKLSTKPILLEPYIEELQATADWAKWSSYVPSKTQLLDNYLKLLRVPMETSDIKGVLQDLTRKDISSLIAIVTGIVSIGVERFNDVLTNRLVRGSPDGPLEDVGLNLVPRGEVISTAVSVFEDYFEKSVRHRNRPANQDRWADRSRELIQINNRRDALAVDQLLQLNEIYNPKKHLILYLSSTPKSAELFGSAGVPRPIINGKPYDLLRTARDLFIYMVYRGDLEDPVENAEVAISRLSEVNELIGTVEGIRDKFKEVSLECEHCNRDESLPLCEFGNLCDGVLKQGEHIAQKQEANINLSMQKRLAQAIASARHESRTDPSKRYGQILQFLSELIKDKKALKAINQEMEVNLESSITKMRFVSDFMATKSSEIGLQFSCYLNYYPIRLSITEESLRNIVKGVVEILPKPLWSVKRFRESVGDYLKVDANWDINAESELVRCFLYSIMADSDRSLQSAAMQVAERYLSGGELTSENLVREFRYLQCFILWHANEFQKAIDVADACISKYRRDGRFHHCRSIIIWDWLRKRESPTQYGWEEVVAATKDAIRFFTKVSDREMVAVNHNNLAYIYASDYSEGLNVELAEEHLKALAKWMPEQEWSPRCPEFFHTKGTTLLARFLISEDPNTLRAAYKDAQEAYRLFPEKIEHRELVETIERYAAERNVLLPASGPAF